MFNLIVKILRQQYVLNCNVLRDDNYDNLFTCFKSIAKELEAFKLVTINGTSYGVKLHLNGDYKSICSAVGHTGAASAHPCIEDTMYSVDSADYQEHDDLATVPDSPETFATFIELFSHNLKKSEQKPLNTG
uniref:Polyprotein n=1 Tax=Rhabditophanes sp. KR3021 TaxID=114890 RepID=A0AC35UFM1_9BILA